MKKYSIILVGAIVILAFFLRMYAVNRVPSGIDWDEASFGYNAFSIAKNGTDEWGKHFPLLFTAFGDFKLPTYIYLTSFVVKFIGLSVFSVRFVSVVSGTLSVFLVYLIALILFRKKYIALIAAFCTALSPYGIFYSRLALDIGLSNTLILLAIFFQLKFIAGRRPPYLLASILTLAFTFFTYNIGRIIAPIFMVVFLIIYVGFLKTSFKQLLVPLFIILMTAVVGIFQLKQGGASRMQFVGIFGENKSVTLDINELRDHDKNNIVSKILHNKATFFSQKLLENYTGHFSSSFLTHDSVPQTVQVSPSGPLYPIQLPFYYIGLILLIQIFLKEKNKLTKMSYGMFIIWVAISPFPSMITEGEISRRYLGALGTWEIMTAYGISFVFEKIKSGTGKLFFATGTSLLYGISASIFLIFYFTELPAYKNVYFHQQNLMGQVIAENYNKYDRLVISKKTTGEPQIFILFFSRFDPVKYNQTKSAVWENNWVNVQGFDKTALPAEITPEYLRSLPFSQKRIMIVLTSDELIQSSEVVSAKRLHATPLDITNSGKLRLFVLTNQI